VLAAVAAPTQRSNEKVIDIEEHLRCWSNLWILSVDSSYRYYYPELSYSTFYDNCEINMVQVIVLNLFTFSYIVSWRCILVV
jgi:hypothetical protein